MQIEVGWFDVLLGKRRNSAGCMVARAVRRALPGYHVAVGRDMITVLGGKQLAEMRLPLYVRRRIRWFDNGEWVRPFAFELDLQEVPARLPVGNEMLEPVGCVAV